VKNRIVAAEIMVRQIRVSMDVVIATRICRGGFAARSSGNPTV
jgi:hypothetical protein